MKHSDLITLTGEHRVPPKEHVTNVQRGLGTVIGAEALWRLFLAEKLFGLYAGQGLGVELIVRRVDRVDA